MTARKIPDNPPMKRADFTAGRLVLRKRGVNGAMLRVDTSEPGQSGEITAKQLAAIRKAAPTARGKVISSLT